MQEEEQARVRRQRISEISQTIEQLSIELNDLLLEEQIEEQGQQTSDDEQVDLGPASSNRPNTRGATRNSSSGNIDNQQQQTSRRATESNNNDEDQEEQELEIGRRAVILNHYQGLQGKIGFITKITKKQVTLAVPGQSKPVVRNKSNVRVVL